MQEPTKQLQEEYASDCESTNDQPLSLQQMHMHIRGQRSEYSAGGLHTEENPLSPVLSLPQSAGTPQTLASTVYLVGTQLAPLSQEPSALQGSSMTGAFVRYLLVQFGTNR